VAAIGTAAYLYRELLHPFLRRLWQHNYTVEAVNHLDRKTLEVMLAPVAQPVWFVAGQIVFVCFGGGYGWERHPFTISSAPQESLLHLAIKGLGDETQRLIDTLQPGVPARVGRAFGMFDYRSGRYRGVRKKLFDLRRCAVVYNLHVLARSQQLSVEVLDAA
jgi:predicted ferric reductase